MVASGLLSKQVGGELDIGEIAVSRTPSFSWPLELPWSWVRRFTGFGPGRSLKFPGGGRYLHDAADLAVRAAGGGPSA
jgi:hypothetical protein